MRYTALYNKVTKVFEFFVQFHNQVNQRHGKEIMSVEDAYKLYSGEIENKITYS